MNLDEFYRASATLNRKLTILLTRNDHFVPVNQLSLAAGAVILEIVHPVPGGQATITLDQFLTRTSHLPPTTDLRALNTHQMLFGFRIVNKSIVFY